MKPYLYFATLLCCFSAISCKPSVDNGPVLHPVGLEAVEMSGELAERVQRNFNRMETELYQPQQVFWTEEESGGWPADKEGRTILALVLDGRASAKRKPIYLDSLIQQLPAHMNSKGYLGTIHSDFVDEQQLSGHGWLLRGLCEYFQWTGDSSAIAMAKRIADNLFAPIEDRVDSYPIDPARREACVGGMSGSAGAVIDGWRLSSDIGCVFIGMDGLIHYYSINPDPKLRPLIEKLINRFRQIDLTGIKAQTHASLTAMRGLLRYYGITGDTSLVNTVEERWKVYKIWGMTENFENYNWFDRYDTWTEPCAIIDSYMLAVQLWAITRNPQYLQDAELIYYNAIGATQRDNGGFGCNKPLGPCFNAMQRNCDEAHWCCTMRGGEGLGRAVEYSCFVSADTVFLPFYNESAVRIPRLVGMRIATTYPEGDSVTIEVDSASSPVLALRLPEHMIVNSLQVNGENAGYTADKGFAVLNRRLNGGDSITLTYAFEPKAAPVLNSECAKLGLAKLMYGPLVMGNPQTKQVLFDHVPTDLRKTADGRIVADGDTLVPVRDIRF